VDLATLLGMIGAFGLVLMSMGQSAEFMTFVNPPSLMIVVGGSLFVMMTRYSMGQFFKVLATIGKAFVFKTQDPVDVIELCVNLADAARRNGFLALQEVEISIKFMQKAIDMLVDGYDANVVAQFLEQDIDLTAERHELCINFFKKLGDVAPAMGMIGTLIGLVAMLANMDDPKAIGPAMAVALLTTMYGSIIGNMIAIPVADKLELRMNEEVLVRRMCMEAIGGIQSGMNPRVIESSLKNYINEGRREFDVTPTGG
jgi:chemotaxis protein MotA